jgi:predicted TIM-barrel fold metal-dependent hydrolase
LTTDCHTHISGADHLSDLFREQAERVWDGLKLDKSLDEHWAAVAAVDRAIVLGFRASASGWVVPNEFVANYVRRHPEKLIGFAGIDLAEENPGEEVDRAVDMGLRGLKLGPIYQNVHPLDDRASVVYERAEQKGLPIVWHQGATFVRNGRLACARPTDIDEVAIRHPGLRVVIAHMGHPWTEDSIVVARKHPNVYMDISGLHPRPWQFYNALRLAFEYRVSEKLLFGSDYPFFTIAETLEGLKEIQQVAERANLPPIPETMVEEIAHRDGLGVLGL